MSSFVPDIPGTPHTRIATSHQWRWRLLVTMGAAFLAASLITSRHTGDDLAVAQVRLSAWQTQPPSAAVGPATPAEQPSDFVQHLPTTFAPEHLMAVIERARQDHGVTLGRVQFDPRPPEAGQLGTTDLSLTLKAPYPALKAMLADVTARCPELTLVRLSLQHPNGDTQTEAQVAFRAWSQAKASDSAATKAAATSPR